MTIKGKHATLDWTIDKFSAGDSKFHAKTNFNITYGSDQTGDLTKQENILHLKQLVEKETNGVGLNLVMADGVKKKK